MQNRFPRVAALLTHQLQDRRLEFIVLLHLADHFVVLLVVHYDLSDRKGRSRFQLDSVHLFSSQVHLNRSWVGNYFMDIVVVDCK